MIFGKGERRRTKRISNENLPKSAEIAAFWQCSYYSCLASDSKKRTQDFLSGSFYFRLVRVTGVEPARPCGHKNLNLTRLPIPPYPRAT